jgi:hypothetical protein
MKRRKVIKAGLGAALAGTFLATKNAHAAPQAAVVASLQLGENGPIYEAKPARVLALRDAVSLEAWIRADAMPHFTTARCRPHK